MFLRGVANTFDNVDARAAGPLGRPGRLQDVGLPRRAGHQRQRDQRLRRGELRRAADRPQPPLPFRPDRRTAVPGTRATRARPRARTRRRPPATRSTTTPSSARTSSDIPHTFNGSLIYMLPGEGLWARRLARRRHRQRAQRRADQRHHQPARHASRRRRHGDQRARRQHARHAAARSRARRRPVPEGRRAVAQPGGLRGAAARHVRQPAAQLPPRPGVLAGRPDDQQGLPVRPEPGHADPAGDLQHH